MLQKVTANRRGATWTMQLILNTLVLKCIDFFFSDYFGAQRMKPQNFVYSGNKKYPKTIAEILGSSLSRCGHGEGHTGLSTVK